MNGPQIANRFAMPPQRGACCGCGANHMITEGCWQCGTLNASDWFNPVGRIDAVYETFGGEHRIVSAERHPDGGWEPVTNHPGAFT